VTGRGVRCGAGVPGGRRRLPNRLFGFTLRFCPVCRYEEPSALSGGCRGAVSPNLLVLLCVPCESSGVVLWFGVYLAGGVSVVSVGWSCRPFWRRRGGCLCGGGCPILDPHPLIWSPAPDVIRVPIGVMWSVWAVCGCVGLIRWTGCSRSIRHGSRMSRRRLRCVRSPIRSLGWVGGVAFPRG
jgi:hypothetical protein